jgi:short-subunit dehydrogenase
MPSVFITGAASGIGLATAKHFAQQGWFVGRYDLNLEALEATQNEQDFPSSCYLQCDVTNDDQIDAALAHFAQQTDGQLNVLINNAGVLSCGEFTELSLQQQDLIIDINIKAMTHVAYKTFPLLKATPKSTMINICSASSIHGIPYLAVYSASKFFVNGFTQALQIEWEKHGIRVLSAKPAFVKTPMFDAIPESMAKIMTADLTDTGMAEEIFNTLSTNKLSYMFPAKTTVWNFLNKLLPEKVGSKITKKIVKA